MMDYSETKDTLLLDETVQQERLDPSRSKPEDNQEKGKMSARTQRELLTVRASDCPKTDLST